jgi:hypothetical protein
MPNWTRFQQDPDLPDPSDFGAGYFYDEQGNGQYHWDPALATKLSGYDALNASMPERSMSSATDAALEQPIAAPPAAPKANASEQLMSASKAPEPPPQDHPDYELAPVKGLDKTTPEFRAELVKQSQMAGLDPSKVAGLIAMESDFNSGAKDKNGANAGLLGFSSKYWGEVAANAGTPNVSWEDMQKMSPEEQLPYVMSYLKAKNLNAASPMRDYRLATIFPAGRQMQDDDVAFEKGNAARVGRESFSSDTGYQQNEALDKNRDGKITVGELAAAPAAGAAPAGAGGQSMRQQSLATGAPPTGVAPGLAGAVATSAQVQGVPLTPEQVQQRQQDVRDRTDAAIATDYAAQLAVANAQTQAQQAERFRQEVIAETERKKAEAAAKARFDINTKLEQEFAKPMQALDAKQYFKQLSGGERVLQAIGLIAGALSQAGFAMLGIKTDNPGVTLVNQAVQANIEKQREQIFQGRQDKNNRIQHYRELGNSYENAEKLATAEQQMAAAKAATSQAATLEIGSKAYAEHMRFAQQMTDQGQKSVQQVADSEANRLTTQYSAKAPVDPLAQQKTQAEIELLHAKAMAAEGKNAAPPVLPVGVENQSPETRQALIQRYRGTDAERKEQQKLSVAMAPIEDKRHVVLELESLLGVKPDANGRYNADEINTRATGFMKSFVGLTGNDRDRAIRDQLDKLGLANLAALAREPNSIKTQGKAENLYEPGWDRDFARKLQNLRDDVTHATSQTLSGYSPVIRAVWAESVQYPYTVQAARPAGRIVQ